MTYNWSQWELDLNLQQAEAQSNLISFSDDSKATIREALDAWSNFSALTFVEVTETASDFGDIRFTQINFSEWFNLTNDDYFNSGGFAYFPSPVNDAPTSGDIVLPGELRQQCPQYTWLRLPLLPHRP